MNRRAFLAGLTASAAGLLLPERKVWALDRTMIPTRVRVPYDRAFFDVDPVAAVMVESTRDWDGPLVITLDDFAQPTMRTMMRLGWKPDGIRSYGNRVVQRMVNPGSEWWPTIIDLDAPQI